MGRQSAASATGPCVDDVYIPAGAAVLWPVCWVALQTILTMVRRCFAPAVLCLKPDVAKDNQDAHTEERGGGFFIHYVLYPSSK